jgi:Tol biopolymer transport system component
VNIAGLFLMQGDGSDVRVLTTNKTLGADSWSPDGRRLVGTSFQSPPGMTGQPLVAYDTDGTHIRQITSGASTDENSSWSPRGDRIAFTSTSPTSIDNVWVVDTDGTHLTQLTNYSGQSAWPTWSPDGSQIAYMSEANGRIAHIWVMNADGSNPHQLTTDPPGDGQPAWSPDGSKIAFVSQRDGYLQIYVMNTDGTGQTRLTNDTLSDQGPFFSPDGAQIAFTQQTPADLEALLIMNTDASNLRVLRGNVGGAAWKPYPPASLAARSTKRPRAPITHGTQLERTR